VDGVWGTGTDEISDLPVVLDHRHRWTAHLDPMVLLRVGPCIREITEGETVVVAAPALSPVARIPRYLEA
jgi:hypothetical protein